MTTRTKQGYAPVQTGGSVKPPTDGKTKAIKIITGIMLGIIVIIAITFGIVFAFDSSKKNGEKKLQDTLNKGDLSKSLPKNMILFNATEDPKNVSPPSAKTQDALNKSFKKYQDSLDAYKKANPNADVSDYFGVTTPRWQPGANNLNSNGELVGPLVSSGSKEDVLPSNS